MDIVAHIKTQKYIRFWRKHGALINLIGIISSAFISSEAVGFFTLLMITVPCGIKWVNTNWFIWYLRQAYFAIMGTLIIIV